MLMEAKRPRVGRLSSIIAIALVVLFGIGFLYSGAAAQKVGSLDKVDISREDDVFKVLLSGELPSDYISYKDIGPLRIVVDLPSTRPSVAPTLNVQNGVINVVTIKTLEPASDSPSTRVEMGLDADASFTAEKTPQGIVVSIEATGAPMARAEKPEPVAPAAAEPAEEEPAPAPPALPAAPETATMKPTGGPASVVNSLDVVTEDGASRVLVAADGRLDNFNAFVLTNPARLVVDIYDVRSTLARSSYSVDGPVVQRVRVGDTYKNKVRLVVDFADDRVQPYNLVTGETSLAIRLGATGDSRPSRIKAMDYKVTDDGKATVTIKTDHKPSYDIKRTSSNELLLTLYKTSVPLRLRRPFDTSQFRSSAVDTFVAKPSLKKPGSVELELAMRDMVPYHVAWEGDNLLLEFDATSEPVKEPMDLPAPASAPEEMAEAAPREAAGPAAPMGRVISGTGQDVEMSSVGGPLISLDLQDAALRNVLRLLAELTDKNLVVEPGVKGKVTMRVENVPWRQVLQLVLQINELGMTEQGNVIRIAEAKKLHQEEMQRLKREQEALEAERKQAKAAEDVGELKTEYLQVNYANADDIKAKINEIKSKDGSISVDTRTNTIIYKDYTGRIENAKALLTRLDKPTSQVLIEARIVTATKNFTRRLGIQWGGSASRNSDHLGGTSTISGLLGGQNLAVNVPPSAAFGGVGWTFSRIAGDTISNLSVAIQALENEGYGRVISSPKILTMDNTTATIQQGKSIPYPKQTEDGISTEFINATLELNVTPHVTPDNRVQVQMVAKKNAPDFGNTVGGTPSIDTQEASTELLVNDGDTVVIGGIISQEDTTSYDKVPGFADVPILGWFFKSKTRVMSTRELLIFLSPRIVQL